MSEEENGADSERRESLRVQISSGVRVKTVTEFMKGSGADVSVGGMYVVTDQNLPKGTLLNVEFEVEELDRKFKVLGEVRWRQRESGGGDRRGLGIKFLDLTREDRRALHEFIEQREPVEGQVPPEEVDKDRRRAGERVPISTTVELKTVANLTAARGSDLSIGGIYLLSSQKYEVGTHVDLEFTVQGIDRIFRVFGEVKWQERQPVETREWWSLGIEFEDLDPEERKYLEEFIKQREPRAHSERSAPTEAGA